MKKLKQRKEKLLSEDQAVGVPSNVQLPGSQASHTEDQKKQIHFRFRSASYLVLQLPKDLERQLSLTHALALLLLNLLILMYIRATT